MNSSRAPDHIEVLTREDVFTLACLGISFLTVFDWGSYSLRCGSRCASEEICVITPSATDMSIQTTGFRTEPSRNTTLQPRVEDIIFALCCSHAIMLHDLGHVSTQ